MTTEELWEKMSREDWLAGEGFSGKMGGLTKIPTVCKPRIFEFANEYAKSERNKTIDEAVVLLVKRGISEADYNGKIVLDTLRSLKVNP